jgi:hypothetical protein
MKATGTQWLPMWARSRLALRLKRREAMTFSREFDVAVDCEF